MLAIAEAGGHSPSLAEAGEGHHLPGLGNLEGTSLSQGLTACKRNKQTKRALSTKKKWISNFKQAILHPNSLR